MGKPIGRRINPGYLQAWRNALLNESLAPAARDPVTGQVQTYSVLPKICRRSPQEGKEKAPVPHTLGFYDRGQATASQKHWE